MGLVPSMAGVFFKNATPTHRGPAFTGIEILSPGSTNEPESATGFRPWSSGLPPTVNRAASAAVDADLDLVPLFQRMNLVVVIPLQWKSHHILAVEREVVTNRDAAPGSERELLARPIDLLEALGHFVGRDHRAHGRIPDGKTAHRLRGRHVAFEQRSRHGQQVGDVVEPVGRILGGEERARVDLERQQIAYRVGVFGSIGAMNRGPSGVGPRRGGPFERGLQSGRERVVRGGVRARPTGRRHRARAQLARPPSPIPRDWWQRDRHRDCRAQDPPSSTFRCDSRRSSDRGTIDPTPRSSERRPPASDPAAPRFRRSPSRNRPGRSAGTLRRSRIVPSRQERRRNGLLTVPSLREPAYRPPSSRNKSPVFVRTRARIRLPPWMTCSAAVNGVSPRTFSALT